MGSRHRGSAPEVLALDTFIKLVRAAETVGARVNATYANAGLTVSQFGAMEALYHLGPLCQSEIGRKILRSSGNITLVIDNLEKRGFVRRARLGSDRRRMIVELTPAGHALIEGIFPEHAERLTESLSVLSPHEQASLGVLCKKLGVALAAAPSKRE